MSAEEQNMSRSRSDASIIQAQKQQRLRVNRVAIVQALKVDHVIPNLLKHNVIDDDERRTILKGKTSQDKARHLIDLIPTKGKEVDWYGVFKESLRNPETRSSDVKKKYQILISFLDNTIMPPGLTPRTPHGMGRQVSSASSTDSNVDDRKLPHYQTLPSISSSTDSPTKYNRSGSRVTFDVQGDESREPEGASSHGDTEKGSTEEPENSNKDKKPMTLVKGFYRKWVPAPENFVSLIQIPQEHFDSLESSEDPEDTAQLPEEKVALERIRQLETIFALDRRGQLPEGFELSMSSAVEDVLQEPQSYHLYFKYFVEMKIKHNIDIPAELAGSLCQFIANAADASDEEIRELVVRNGFALFDFLHEFGHYSYAHKLITTMIAFLNTNMALETWMASWEALVKLLSIYTTNVNYKFADYALTAANNLKTKIDAMSFGKDLLDESQLFMELSRMMRDQGSIGPSYSWAQAAMKEVEDDNYQGIVEALCNGSVAYAMRYNVKKAEELAIQAVRQAKKFFNTNHPLYVKALLHYCFYANEFKQDEMTIAVARKALSLCKKIYGGVPTVLTAIAHQTLARALVVNQQFSDEDYYDHAFEAYLMAQDCIPGDHPKFALFKYSLAQSLYWRAQHGDSEQKIGNFIWAESLAKQCISIFSSSWGEYSLKRAQSYLLLVQIYAKMEQWEKAEDMMLASKVLHRLSIGGNSAQMYFFKATLGTFYKITDRPLDAISELKEVVDHFDSTGTYLKWVHVCYDTLIILLRAINKEKEAEVYQATLIDWMKKNPKSTRVVTWGDLHQVPLAYPDFYKEFNQLHNVLQKHKKGLRNLKVNMLKSSGQN